MKQKTLFIEGKRNDQVGTIDQNRAFAGVADSNLSLQNAFSTLFEQVISPIDTRFIIEMTGGWKAALKHFAKSLKSENGENMGLLIDFIDIDSSQKAPVERGDRCKTLLSQLELWIQNGELPNQAAFYFGAFQKVFFMKMKMEGWILSQFEIIEECYGSANFNRTAFNAQKKRLIKTHASELPKPDEVLHELLRYFEVERNGKTRKMGYQKGRHDAELIRRLDAHKLMDDFEDVRNLVAFLKNGQPDEN